MTFGAPLGRVIARPFGGVPSSAWWLSGGIAAANCVAAYQPKGAGSYALSKVNLANPGIHNAADGAAYPDWDVTNGWKASAASSQYLTTDITMGTSATNQSCIARFSNVTASGVQYLFGTYTSNKRYAIVVYSWGSLITHCYNQTTLAGLGKTSGVLCMAGANLYYNGSDIADINVGTTQTSDALYICGANNAGALFQPLNGYIQAIAFYNTALTSTQIGLLTTAINAL